MEEDEQTDEEFLRYLETTLIPDLLESGLTATADDFIRLVGMVREREPGGVKAL